KEALAPKRGALANGFMNIMRSVHEVLGVFLFGGTVDKFPNLKMVIAEADAGWIPHYAYRADHAVKRLGAIAESKLSKMPSEYITKNVSFTFQDDATAYLNQDVVNSGCLVWANDYPHTDATWPWSQDVLKAQTANLTETQRNAILHDNVKRLFNLPIQA